MKFQLVLPCYNEEKSLEHLINRSKSAAEKHGLTSSEFQLVMVENGSRDRSREALDKLRTSELGQWFKVVVVEQNQGYGNGLWAGLSSTEAEVVSWSHADQQCDPADAVKAMLMVSESPGRTLVKGKRFGRNWKDALVSRVFETFSSVILGLRAREINAQPKAFRRELLSSVHHPPKNFAFDLYVLYVAEKLGYTLKEIPVEFPPRVHGLSNWSSHFLGRYKTILSMIAYMFELSRTEGRL